MKFFSKKTEGKAYPPAQYSQEFESLEHAFCDEHWRTAKNPYLFHADTLADLELQNHSLLKEIWGVEERSVLKPAHYLAHFALFSIPESILSARRMKPERYSLNLEFELGVSAYQIGCATGVYDESNFGLEPHTLDRMRRIVFEFHLPGKDRKRFRGEDSHRARYPGIPHILMAYNILEEIRAAEFCRLQEGKEISDRDKEDHYHYFAEAIQRAGYIMPHDREEMEDYAKSVDSALVRNHAVVDSVLRRLMRLNHRLDYVEDDDITLFLRPKSAELLEEIRNSKPPYFNRND